MYSTDFGTLWERARAGCSERAALRMVYSPGWAGSPAQVGCKGWVLRVGALGRPGGMGWGGMWEGGSGWGAHVDPWLAHVDVWRKSLQYCKVISLQLIKVNGKKKEFLHSDAIFLYIQYLFSKENQNTNTVINLSYISNALQLILDRMQHNNRHKQ